MVIPCIPVTAILAAKGRATFDGDSVRETLGILRSFIRPSDVLPQEPKMALGTNCTLVSQIEKEQKANK